jgi:hypothetical protein
MKLKKLFLVGLLTIILATLVVLVPAMPAMAAVGTAYVYPTSGPPGTAVTITGSGYTASSTYTIYFSTTLVASGIVGAGGSISAFFTAPTLSRTTYPITITTTAGDTTSTVPTFTIIFTPTISLSSSQVIGGSPITVNGTGFNPSWPITVYLDGTTIGSTTSDVSGAFTGLSVTLPQGMGGVHTLTANDGLGDIATASVTYIASLTINPNSGAAGSQIAISGKGFVASSPVTLTIDGTAVSGGSAADASGNFTNNNFTLPNIAGGTHTLKAQDASGNSATASFTVSSFMSISPTSGPSGTTVTIKGNGYLPSTPITVNVNGAKILTNNTSLLSDATGSFTTTFAMPQSAAGAIPISATDSTNTGSANFTITATGGIKTGTGATGTATQGPIGTSVTISGTSFKANSTVGITYGNSQIATVTSDAGGNFTATFNTPTSSSGEHLITATDQVNTLTFTFTIVPTATINATSGNVGSNLIINGTGFSSNKTVTVKYDASQATTSQADANGTFTAAFNVPASVHGNHLITVSDGTNTSTFNFAMDATPPPVPELLSPANGTSASTTPALGWSPVTDPSGVTYTLQLASDSAFGNILVQKEGLTNSSYQLTQQEVLKSVSKDSPYYWRVKAVDAASNDSGFSKPNTFFVGFVLANWALYLIFGVSALIIGIIGFIIGRRTGHAA